MEARNVELGRVLVAYLQPSDEAAIAIARSHTDEYIRDRLAYQLGETRSIPCLPSGTLGGGAG